MPKPIPRLFLVAAVLTAASLTTHAATQTWDTDLTAGAAAGTSTWDLTLANWTQDGGATNQVWVNGNDAVFTGGRANLGSAAITAGTIDVNGAGSFVFGGTLANLTVTQLNVNTTGAGKLSVNPSGTRTLTATNISIASGATLYVAGTNAVSGAISISGSGNTENLGALRIDTGGTLSGTINLTGNTSIGAFGGVGTIASAISGGFGITKVGAGNNVLSGNNTYTGNTTVSAGTLTVAASTGAIHVGAAAGGVTVASGATLAVSGKLILTSIVSGSIANAGTLTLDAGTSVLDLAGLFNGQADGSTYQLLSGAGTTTGNFSNITGYAPGSVSFDNSTGLLTFTSAVPEPSTYGLIGAGALAAVAFVRRRRKVA